MKTQRKYVMTDEVWDMLMDALEQAIAYMEHYERDDDVVEAEIAEMHRLIDTVEVREEVVA
tara:strand:- start:2323 stop:2505 length:183 start_codon:yes stop_codon:yes gene_type:complete